MPACRLEFARKDGVYNRVRSLWGQLPQRSLVGWEIARAQRLNPGGVIAIEWGHTAKTTGV